MNEWKGNKHIESQHRNRKKKKDKGLVYERNAEISQNNLENNFKHIQKSKE